MEGWDGTVYLPCLDRWDCFCVGGLDAVLRFDLHSSFFVLLCVPQTYQIFFIAGVLGLMLFEPLLSSILARLEIKTQLTVSLIFGRVSSVAVGGNFVLFFTVDLADGAV